MLPLWTNLQTSTVYTTRIICVQQEICLRSMEIFVWNELLPEVLDGEVIAHVESRFKCTKYIMSNFCPKDWMEKSHLQEKNSSCTVLLCQSRTITKLRIEHYSCWHLQSLNSICRAKWEVCLLSECDSTMCIWDSKISLRISCINNTAIHQEVDTVNFVITTDYDIQYGHHHIFTI